MMYASPKIALNAPFQRNGRWVMAGDLELASGDTVRLEAEVTPETLARVARGGMAMGRALKMWSRKNVSLRGDWSSLGEVSRVAYGVLEDTARHPLLNLPVLGSEDDKSHPAYSMARDLLAGDGYVSFDKLRALACTPRAKADYTVLMAACCHLGNCCCGKKQIRGCYDVSYLLDHPWEAPADRVAMAVTDCQALRSYRAIFGR